MTQETITRWFDDTTKQHVISFDEYMRFHQSYFLKLENEKIENTSLKLINALLEHQITDLKEEIKMWENWHQNLLEVTSEATTEDMKNLFKDESAGE